MIMFATALYGVFVSVSTVSIFGLNSDWIFKLKNTYSVRNRDLETCNTTKSSRKIRTQGLVWQLSILGDYQIKETEEPCSNYLTRESEI